MPPSLDPLIAERLCAFAQRWTRMVRVRGLCAAAVTLLVAFTAVAWLDRFLVLTEATRWLLSLGGYAATALVFWLVAGRTLARPLSTREFAVLMEKAWPGLRSHLVAAVELAEKSAEGKNDSFAFRDLVQEGVARRVRDLRMEVVLPRAHVAVWVRTALGCFSVVAGMFAVPALEFPRQFARALLPMADIERVARTKIRVVEPAPDTRWLAQGDHQSVVVELGGADTGRAELEVLAADGKAERVQMSPGSGVQFTATVPVGQGAFAFRVRAGDALTKTVTIATRARPSVVAFAKTYEAPAYAQLAERQVTEEHGNLSALEGSVADVRMRVNQAVRAGELAIVADGKTNLVALTAPEPNVVHARIPVRGAATYQVRLVAAETGLENKFSPTFEIRAEPDLAPRVTLESPRTDLVVSSDEVIAVRGIAGDDVGLAAVAQHFQVNTGPWVEVPLALANKTNSPVTHRWDLLLLGLSTGDRVVTKLVAVDLRGTRVESGSASLTVGAAKSDPSRSATIAAQRAAQESLESASRVAAELRSEFSPEAMAKLGAGEVGQRQKMLAGAESTLAGVATRLDRAAQQLDAASAQAGTNRAAVDLALLNQAVASVRNESLAKARAEQERLGQAAPDAVPAAAQAAQKAALRLADQTAQLAAQARELTAAEQGEAVARRLEELAKEQGRQAEAGTNAPAGPAAKSEAERQRAAASQEAARAERDLGELRPQVPKPAGERLAKAQEHLQSAQKAAERVSQRSGQESAAKAGQEKSAKAAGAETPAPKGSGEKGEGAKGEGAKGEKGEGEKGGKGEKGSGEKGEQGAGAESPGAGGTAEAEAAAARQFRQGVEQAASLARSVGREQAMRADKARGELAKSAEGGAQAQSGLRREVERLVQGERRVAGAQSAGGDDPAQQAKNSALAQELLSKLALPPRPGTGTGAPGSAGAGGGGRTAGGGSAAAMGAIPELGEVKDGEWAKLPPKLAQDLREAQRNGVSGDYRALVDAYFKALAEKARK